MQYRRLGRSGIKLSTIGLGNWLTFGRGVDEIRSRACIRRAFELGVNFFDTADVYHKGAAEEIYGRELKAFRRRELVIATKCFFPFTEAANDRGLSRKHIFESLHDSLVRLQTEYVDLYQCHRFDPEVEPFEVVRAMDDAVRQGKILYWGVSEWPAAAIEQACDLAAQMHACPPASNQPEYSLAARRVETNGVQAACVKHGLGMVVWSPLRQGLLTGKYAGGKAPPGSRAADPLMNQFMPEIDRRIVDRVEQLRPLAEKRGIRLAQLAIAWLLKRQGVTSAIIGATRTEQIEENCAAAELSLDEEVMRRAAALFPPAEFQ
jgi:voltage-dependent potassium channel beta subunit